MKNSLLFRLRLVLIKPNIPSVLNPLDLSSAFLHVCAERNFVEIAEAIIQFDVDKNSKLVFEVTDIDEEGEGAMTCLHVACEWNSQDLVELFYQYGGE